MAQKIKFGGSEYDVENMSDRVKKKFALLHFANTRIQELDNMQALLRCAKKSYGETLRQEMLSNKAGILFGDD